MPDNTDVDNQLAEAIKTKFAALVAGENNALWIALNGQLFDGDASGGVYPYAAFWSVSSVNDDTFTEEITDHLIQFDFFSTVSAADAKRLRFLARQLFHEKSLTMTGSTVIWIRESNRSGGDVPEDVPTQDAGNKVWHAIAEYEIKTSLD